MLLCALLLCLLIPTAAAGQTPSLSVEEAIQIALEQNYALQVSRLDVTNAQAQIREAWGQVLPQVNLDGSYTRNLKSPNPFAGSDAGGLFGSLGALDWLAFNEDARTDDDPSTEPISLMEFRNRQAEGFSEAGISVSGGDNPFAVPNQFQAALSITQSLYNGSAFAAIQGAEALLEVNEAGAARQAHQVINDTRQAYYQALLAHQQADVHRASVARIRETVAETSKLVKQGVAPKYQRLSVEVELANLESALIQVETQAATALDNLKLTLGLPIEQPITLRDELEVDPSYLLTSIQEDAAIEAALDRRPDVQQARLGVELQKVQMNITRAQYRPTVSAFANFGYTGSVPDDRTRVLTDPNDPFSFSQETNGFFSSDYFNPSASVGVRMSWNLFNGFQTTSRVQQNRVAISQAQVQYDQLVAGVRLEVAAALRNLRAAQQRILSQEQNVDRAELNYEYADARLREGVASQLELRDASQQLDQSRLNYLQAVYDYLVARSNFETALGMPQADPATLNLTSR